jgi:hypothetical protein
VAEWGREPERLNLGAGGAEEECPQEWGHGSLEGRSTVGFPQSPMPRRTSVMEWDRKPERVDLGAGGAEEECPRQLYGQVEWPCRNFC